MPFKKTHITAAHRGLSSFVAVAINWRRHLAVVLAGTVVLFGGLAVSYALPVTAAHAEECADCSQQYCEPDATCVDGGPGGSTDTGAPIPDAPTPDPSPSDTTTTPQPPPGTGTPNDDSKNPTTPDPSVLPPLPAIPTLEEQTKAACEDLKVEQEREQLANKAGAVLSPDPHPERAYDPRYNLPPRKNHAGGDHLHTHVDPPEDLTGNDPVQDPTEQWPSEGEAACGD